MNMTSNMTCVLLSILYNWYKRYNQLVNYFCFCFKCAALTTEGSLSLPPLHDACTLFYVVLCRVCVVHVVANSHSHSLRNWLKDWTCGKRINLGPKKQKKTSLPKQQIGAGHDATISLQIPSKFSGSPKKTCPQCEHYEVCFSECPHSHHPSCTLLINPGAAKIITF